MGLKQIFYIQIGIFLILFLYYFNKSNSLFNPYRNQYHPNQDKIGLSESIILFENHYEILKKVKENKDNEYCICIPAKHRMNELFKPKPAYLSSTLSSMVKYFTEQDWNKVHLKIITQNDERHAEHDYLHPFFNIEKRKNERMKDVKFNIRDDEILDYLTCLEYCNSLENIKYSLILKDHAQLTRRIFPNLEKELLKLKNDHWIWIKLYFSDQFRGWSSSDTIPLIIISSILGLLFTFLYLIYSFIYQKKEYSNIIKLIFFIIFTIYSIIILIMIGKQNLLMDKIGIHKLDENGFALAQLYPKWVLNKIIEKIHNRYDKHHSEYSAGDFVSLEGVLGNIADELKLDKLIYFPYFYKDIEKVSSY